MRTYNMRKIEAAQTQAMQRMAAKKAKAAGYPFLTAELLATEREPLDMRTPPGYDANALLRALEQSAERERRRAPWERWGNGFWYESRDPSTHIRRVVRVDGGSSYDWGGLPTPDGEGLRFESGPDRCAAATIKQFMRWWPMDNWAAPRNVDAVVRVFEVRQVRAGIHQVVVPALDGEDQLAREWAIAECPLARLTPSWLASHGIPASMEI